MGLPSVKISCKIEAYRNMKILGGSWCGKCKKCICLDNRFIQKDTFDPIGRAGFLSFPTSFIGNPGSVFFGWIPAKHCGDDTQALNPSQTTLENEAYLTLVLVSLVVQVPRRITGSKMIKLESISHERLSADGDLGC